MKKWIGWIMIAACVAHAQDVDVFTVTDEVQVKNPPRFGMNYHFGEYQHWKEATECNLWNRYGSFEPLVLAHWGLVEQGGEDFLVSDAAWGMSAWHQMADGFWDGASITIFRMGENGFEAVRTDTVLSSELGREKKDTLRLPKGLSLQPGDWYYLKKRTLKYPEALSEKVRQRNKHPASHFSKNVSYFGSVGWTLDDQTFCPEGGSTASMRLDLEPRGGISEFTTGGDDPRFHTWDEGTYRWECWMRSEDSSTVTVSFGGEHDSVIKESFNVSSKWKKYTFEFAPKEAFEDFNGNPIHSIRVNKKCSLWLDNLVVYRADHPLFDLLPRYRELVREFKPGSMRWSMGIGANSLEACLGDRFNQPMAVNASRGGFASNMHALQIPAFLKLCREIESLPWLTMPGLMLPEDCSALMEYLGGGPDTTYGALRIAHGQTQPWTEVFDRIYIEAGNEQWGANFSHCFNGRPEQYGMLADMQFRIMKDSPFYKPDIVKFVVNGWGKSNGRGWWTQKAAWACPNADYTDTAHYFGGWDGRTLPGEDEKELFQNRMLYAPHLVETDMLRALCLDPNLGKSFADILLKDPVLLEEVVAAIPSPRSPGNVRSVAESYVRTVRALPINQLLRAMASHSSENAALFLELIGLDPQDGIGLRRGVAELLYIEPNAFDAFIRKHPEQIDRIAATLALDEGILADIESVKQGGASGYRIVNGVRNEMYKEIAKRIDKDPAWKEAAAAAVSEVDVSELNRVLINQARRLVNVGAGALQYKIIADLRRNPELARSLLEKVANQSGVPFEEDARTAAASLPKALHSVLNSKSDYLFLSTENLEPSTRAKLVEITCAAIDSLPAKDPMVPGLAKAIVLAEAGGDQAVLEQMCTAPEFVEKTRRSVADAVADAILATLLADSRLAEQIAPAWDKLPKDPSTGNKRLTDYEAGPGYPLPGPGIDPNPQVERYGKSLALGITTLDAFMYNLSRDFDHQHYYIFGFGKYWTSYNNPHDCFPHPSVLTLMMRNLYCEGDLMSVDNSAVKRHDIPPMDSVHINNAGKALTKKLPGRKNIPWVMCYAFQNGPRHSYILYNRSFSEPRTVKLELPYTPSAEATIVRLEHDDPTANNVEEYKIQMKESHVTDFKNGYTFELKPASVVVIVNEQK